MTSAMIAACVALGAVGLAAAFVITAHLAWRDGRLAGHAEMLDAASEYHAQRRIVEADTHPAILAILVSQLDAQQAARDQKEEESRWQPSLIPPRWRSEAG